MELRVPDGLPALAATFISSDSIEGWVGGVRGVGDATPVTAGDRFHLGSNAKAMTATVAAVAVEQGLLTWQDDAEALLGRGRPRGITVERLLSHTAGVRPLAEDEDLVGLPSERSELAALLLSEAPQFEPGTTAEYSNGGYVVMSALLEHVFEAPFETILTDELFEPLEMDAGFGWPTGPIGHYSRDGGLEPQTAGDGYALPPALTAAGDVCTTIDGYARFVQAHLRGLRGVPSLVSVESFRRLHTPIYENFALGWGVQQWEGELSSVHAGSAETFSAIVALQPNRDLAAAAIVNAGGEHASREAVEIVRNLVRAKALT